jgi:hypothetical protein
VRAKITWHFVAGSQALESLIVVKPDTVVRWHRKGFALHWTPLVERKAHQATEDWEGDQGFEPENCGGESALVKSSVTRGTAETRHSYLGALWYTTPPN